MNYLTYTLNRAFFMGLLITATLVTSSCKKDGNAPKEEEKPVTVPDGFIYATSKNVTINVRLLTNGNLPVNGVPVNIFSVNDKTQKTPLFKAISDANGYIKGSLNIPAYLDTLVIEPNYIGLVQHVKSYLVNNLLTCTIGGTEMLSGNAVLDRVTANGKGFTGPGTTVSATSYEYMGLYDLSGRPLYLESPGDVISSDMLSYINFSLPESSDVRNHHPQYLTSTATSNLNVTETSDVFVTFVFEGAGNANSIGYYTYPTANPPANAAAIDKVSYVFPNASASSSGGNMRSGDKVKLGRFTAGTSIGFILLSNAWTGTILKTVNSSATKFYSNTTFNPETTDALKKHTVLLNYKNNNQYIIGFEDISRSSASCDHDFNDIVLYATCSSPTGISSGGILSLDLPLDSDNDGVTNVFDEFPNDAQRAYSSYFPSQSLWGTLAFEDLWPTIGDYDVNDLVVNYRYTFTSNALNALTDITGEYVVVAAGASYQDGFGVEFPFSPSLVSSVTGQRLTGSYIRQKTNGLEEGQTKAVIIPFDNHRSMVSNASSPYINTDPAQAKVKSDTARVKLTFASPVIMVNIGTAPFNPFLISNLQRGYEVHLPGSTPTSLADPKFFNTGQDDYKPLLGKYYLSTTNRPWALSFVETFAYPVEGARIDQGYLHYNDWISSGGLLYANWYKDTFSGYRNNQYIYSK